MILFSNIKTPFFKFLISQDKYFDISIVSSNGVKIITKIRFIKKQISRT